jgi:hypothetical protein
MLNPSEQKTLLSSILKNPTHKKAIVDHLVKLAKNGDGVRDWIKRAISIAKKVSKNPLVRQIASSAWKDVLLPALRARLGSGYCKGKGLMTSGKGLSTSGGQRTVRIRPMRL